MKGIQLCGSAASAPGDAKRVFCFDFSEFVVKVGLIVLTSVCENI